MAANPAWLYDAPLAHNTIVPLGYDELIADFGRERYNSEAADRFAAFITTYFPRNRDRA